MPLTNIDLRLEYTRETGNTFRDLNQQQFEPGTYGFWVEQRALLQLNQRSFLQRCTCIKCKDSETCEFAYDGYNTDGDCLAIK